MNERVHVGIGTYIGGGVTVFPVWPETAVVPYLKWKHEKLVVREVEQGARVDTLQISNEGSWPAVVVEGDIFEGGMQNRTASSTMVIAPFETAEVPVLCVEQGRWNGGRDHGIGTRMRRSPYSVRRRMYAAQTGRNMSAQGEVWDEIQNMQRSRGLEEGMSLAASMERFESMPRSSRTSRVKPIHGQRGIMIGIGGYIAACEIFGNEQGLKARFNAIVEAARYEAMGAPHRSTPNYMARTPLGPLAVSSFALATGLVHAAVLNRAPVGAM
jgi:hypothetical protein